MLLEEYVGIVESAPQSVQKALTLISELEKSVEKEKRALNEEMEKLAILADHTRRSPGTPPARKGEMDAQLQSINANYIQVLDADKKKVAILLDLQKRLEGCVELVRNSAAVFKEHVAQGALVGKLEKIASALECQTLSDTEEEEVEVCVCKQPITEEMLVCDNPECQVQWFHLSCVDLKGVPKTKWLCPNCAPSKQTATPENARDS